MNNNDATDKVVDFQVIRKLTKTRWLLSVRGQAIPFGAGQSMALAIAGGAYLIFDGLRSGDSGTFALGVVFLVAGAVPLWLLLSWRVSFGSNSVISGFWVWRGVYMMSSAFAYHDIARVEFENVNRLTDRVVLSPKNNEYPINVTGAGLIAFRNILVFLSQRVDRAAFDGKALKLLETGEAEKYRFFG